MPETLKEVTAGVTVTFNEIDLVRYVAVMVVLPNAFARTRPAEVTDAMAGLFELHVARVATCRVIPPGHVAVNVNWRVAPIVLNTSELDTSAPPTDNPLISRTLIGRLASFVSNFALTLVVPTATAVTTPAGDTVATAGFNVVHATTSVTVPTPCGVFIVALS